MRVLVTGAAGFIGSHLCERLLADGHEVVGLDLFDDFYDPALKRKNARALLASPGFNLVEGDIRDEALLAATFEHYPPGAVAHIAARAGVRPSVAQPAFYMDVNVVGTARVLDACRLHGVRKVVCASSSSVYGARHEVPFRETDRVDRPESPYAASKAACEAVAHAFHQVHGLDVWCLRYFTAYGPRQRPDMAFRVWASRILAGEPIVLHGDDGVARDFTYVGDVVDGTARAIKAVSGFRVLNVGAGRPTPVGEAASMLATALGMPLRVERRPLPPGDVPITYADTAAAREAMGYVPRVDLATGLGRFAEWLEVA